ncbi:MAG: 3-isopropylmalate dehydrogenase [Dehalococcoidia bacterium]|nr:3-isopropylmalate dehydrogenase [Dehalococcoidia bacterium]
MATFDILVLPGDGIGPEVTAEGVRALEAIGQRFEHVFRFSEDHVGGAAIDAYGVPIRPETLEEAKRSDAVLWGAVGLPKYDNDPSAPVRPEQGLLQLRRDLNLWANLRPVRTEPALTHASTLKPEVIEGVDILVIRELTSGIYFGEPRERRMVDGRREAVNTMYYNEDEVARVAHLGFRAARQRRGKLTSVDKANVLQVSQLWREVVTEVAREYPDVELEHLIVDAATMHLIRRPRDFDVIIAGNLFGDILTDEASMLTGSLGMLPSASLTEPREDGTSLGMYEPIHGSAPDIAGKGIANPLAMVLSAALLLRHSCGLEEEAQALERAVARTIEDGLRTADLASGDERALSTREMADAVLERIGG